MKKILQIENLHCSVNEKPLLKGINFSIKEGQTHVIMGPNGAGKSSLAKVLAGHPLYTIEKGSKILLDHQDLLSLNPEQRAHLGLFVGFQHVPEIPGVDNIHFLLTSYNAKRKALGEKEISKKEFYTLLSEKLKLLEMQKALAENTINQGSGGEKRRLEMLQLAILQPKVAVLDEMDSGLDIQGIQTIAKALNHYRKKGMAIVVITHYTKFFEMLKPDAIHIMIDGKILQSGGSELAQEIETRGYEWATCKR